MELHFVEQLTTKGASFKVRRLVWTGDERGVHTTADHCVARAYIDRGDAEYLRASCYATTGARYEVVTSDLATIDRRA